jgi:hypothetical protein
MTLKMVLVTLLMRSAVPIWLPWLPEPKITIPNPLFGLFWSPIVFAAALTTVVRSTKSWVAGVAMTTGASMILLRSMVWSRARALDEAENMLGLIGS